jgi:hypothetical protein
MVSPGMIQGAVFAFATCLGLCQVNATHCDVSKIPLLAEAFEVQMSAVL